MYMLTPTDQLDILASCDTEPEHIGRVPLPPEAVSSRLSWSESHLLAGDQSEELLGSRPGSLEVIVFFRSLACCPNQKILRL